MGIRLLLMTLLSDLSFQNSKLRNISLAINKTTQCSKVGNADITLVRLFIDSKKLVQAVDEFTKQLKAFAEA